MTERRTILLCDDDTFNQELLARRLRQADFEVRVADHRDAAIDLAGEHAPDLVLAGSVAPGLNGLELACRFRARLHSPIPVILMAESNDVLDPGVLRTVGVRYVIRRPFSCTDLLHEVRRILGPPHEQSATAA